MTESGKPLSLVDHAVLILKERGPMNAKKLADALGLSNARSLSMRLQWSQDRVRFDGKRWSARPELQQLAKATVPPL
jgi:predicted transcriptional regulator